ncbi:Ldh family oxidoreductase [Spirochaeta cellobiosiphila]|uniref:Ldh family oxidoreductase n=1 Tax=Spirochaeta cellobiosiphila TaxID=504483 RepID=UPI00040F79D2|nr:Ldh family oxidoreductase [Spirochaeta cellobiosiphila]
MIRIKREIARQWLYEIFTSLNLSKEAALLSSDIFIRASLRGAGHHDMTYLPDRIRHIEAGDINASGVMTLLDETPVFSRYDGQGALGEYCCSYLLDHSIAKARKMGLALGTVRNSNHFLAGHPYGQIAAEAGCMAIVWSNTDPCMGDPGSEATVIGNNPLGFGAPGVLHPMVLDLCMAYSSLGKLGEHMLAGTEIPSHWGRNSQGELTTDPGDVLNGGVCSPLGGHKGFGLALMNELMTSGLSGGAMGPQVKPKRGWKVHSQTILVISLNEVGAMSQWKGRMEQLRSDIDKRLSEPVRFPGDNLYAHSLINGDDISLPVETWEDMKKISLRLGIDIPNKLPSFSQL